MSRKYFTKMETENAEDMLFGEAKNPVKMGWSQVVGAGNVIPNIKVAPTEGFDGSEACQKGLAIGLPAMQAELEFVQQSKEDSASFTAVQAEKLEEMNDKYGTATSLVTTVADIRDEKTGLKGSDLDTAMDESFEACAENGASALCAKTIGGKAVADYGISRGDIRAILFAIGVLGSIDTEYMWTKIVDIANKNNVVAGGDSCVSANDATIQAGGLIDEDVSHTVAAVTRSIAAAKSLVAVECGATASIVDCAYENPVIKSVANIPIGAAGAQLNLISAAVSDVWTDESALCALMNTAKATGTAKDLRDNLVLADKYRDPQGIVLAYDSAYKIGEAIIAEGENPYLRARAGALKCCEVINEAVDQQRILLTRFERDSLDSAQKTFEQLPDDQDKFIKTCVKRYDRKVKDFDPACYEL